MERCSCCNARLNEQTTCPRCQANLTDVISSEQRAQYLLEHAMQLWFAQESKLAVAVLTQAVAYKKIPKILVFRGFVIRQCCAKLLALLAQGQYQAAQQWLTLLHGLHPNHPLLRQLQGFMQYLDNQPPHSNI